ncbi:MAG: sugar O-acetyltransferase [Erysipelotrichaceae bacterium]|nr:sugar O-acetyltransferase [Erysipelotrichaceae bacterium]
MTEVLHTQEIYDPNEASLQREQRERNALLCAFNSLSRLEEEKREELCRQMFSSFGEGSFIEAPFYANWAGKYVSIGKNVYINFLLTLVDDTYIEIGDNTLIGPNVTITTATHPLDPEERRKGLQFNKPIHIGNNVFIGAGSIILPGVTIGDDSVIAAGSLVSRDIPSKVLAMGSPARVIRSL